ncbi:MAG: tRNA pseudouridine(55) synthase TruB [Anaerovoracaceae bacterium]
MDGFINLLKPAGMTSHDAVSALRRILRMKKIGHTGTLDPMAAGVLSMCIGAGTRAAEYIESEEKKYRCELVLGLSTDTGDIWGTPLQDDVSRADVSINEISEADVLGALQSMKGSQEQFPPMYSAVRKNGKHLYEYARNGETVEVEPRRITVHEISPVAVFHEPGRVLFDVHCSKGTYIRSICTDIGKKLGCGASMSFLVRTASGSFRLEDAVTLEELAAYVSREEKIPPEDVFRYRKNEPLSCSMSDFIVPIQERLDHFGSIILNETEEKKYVNGGKLSSGKIFVEKENSLEPDHRFAGYYRVYGPDGRFLGTSVYDQEKKNYKAGKVFFRW